MHGLAISAVGMAFLSVSLKLLFTAAIVASLLREWARWSGLAGFLCYDEHRGWSLDRPGDELEPLEILGSTVVTPWVVFLHARSEQAQYAWTLCRGGGEVDSFRRLRVYLRVGPVATHSS